MVMKRRKRQVIDPDLIEGGFINDRSGKATSKARKQYGIKEPVKKATPKKQAPKRRK